MKIIFPVNSVFLPSSLLLHPPCLLNQPAFCVHSQPQHKFYRNRGIRQRLCFRPLNSPFASFHPLRLRRLSASATAPSDEEEEGEVALYNFDDFPEKDWSFLETGDINSDGELKRNINLILSAGEVEEASRVLVSIGSEGFVDQITSSLTCCELLLVVHESLLPLCAIIEKHELVNCWQGELIYVPERWAPFDVVFLYFLPGLPFELDQVFGALNERCLPGARIVISHPQGREVLEQQRRQFPDVVTSDLPDEMTLQAVAADHSFQMIEFVDKRGFYLAVLKFRGNDSGK